MGLFVCSNYVFDAYGRLPWKISLKNSNQMITIFHLPFYRDSETFAPRFWQPICFTGWLYLGSNFSVFPVQPLISLVFSSIFYFFHFWNDLWVSNNWNAWFHLLLAIGPFSTKRLRFTAGVPSNKLQSRPIMTKLDPTQPGHMQSTIIWNGKIEK